MDVTGRRISRGQIIPVDPTLSITFSTPSAQLIPLLQALERCLPIDIADDVRASCEINATSVFHLACAIGISAIRVVYRGLRISNFVSNDDRLKPSEAMIKVFLPKRSLTASRAAESLLSRS